MEEILNILYNFLFFQSFGIELLLQLVKIMEAIINVPKYVITFCITFKFLLTLLAFQNSPRFLKWVLDFTFVYHVVNYSLIFVSISNNLELDTSATAL